jgi:hypothetical protein
MIATYVENKMQNFDQIVVPKVERRKWGWHPIFHIFMTIPSLQVFTHLSLDTQQQ